MYLQRKIDNILDNWLKKKDRKPALIVGIRQCGKTESIKEFAKRNKKTLIILNFWDHPEYCLDFNGSLDINTLISNISLRFPDKKIVPDQTILFFDEIQECPRARLAFKNFANDKRYIVIGSGSYLGINGYVIGDSTPAPIGYEEVFCLKTMDFEEFLWANGYSDETVNDLVKFFKDKKQIPENLHLLYKNEYKNYLCLGGFPEVVKKYAETKNIAEGYHILESLVFDMKSDFGRRKGKDGKPLFKPSEVARINNCFELIPTFLSKENKRFITSKIVTGSSHEKTDAIEYLKQSHIVNKVYNVETPSLPLKGYKIISQFKLFPEDIGIVTAMYGYDTLQAINSGNIGIGNGAIYEAAVFDSLNKAGFDCFYFSKESGLEIDFVIAYKNFSYLVEAKTKNGNTKSAKTVMANKEHYGVTKLLKIGDYNIGEVGDIITIPHYLVFALLK